MKTVLLLLSNGVEEIEAIVIIDLLRRAGIEVLTAAVQNEGNLLVRGSHGIGIQADKDFQEILLQDENGFDMLILPGGPAVDFLSANDQVIKFVQQCSQKGMAIAAICAAPLILAKAGLLKNKTVTSFPGARESLLADIKAYSEERVMQDGNLITSRGAGTAEEFAFALIEFLFGKENLLAQKIQRQIVAREF